MAQVSANIFRELTGTVGDLKSEVANAGDGFASYGRGVIGWTKIISGSLDLLLEKFKAFRRGESFDMTATFKAEKAIGIAHGLKIKQAKEAAAAATRKASSTTTSTNNVTINPTIATNNPETMKAALDSWMSDSLHAALP